MEDMADLADMRHLLMERVQVAMASCCEFRNSLDHYSYLYVDDRKEFMRQFLLYGHVLNSQEMEVYADDGVLESPPTLDNFREQVDRWALVKQSLSTHTHKYTQCDKMFLCTLSVLYCWQYGNINIY